MNQRRRRRGIAMLTVLLVFLVIAGVVELQFPGPLPVMVGQAPDAPAPGAVWPWPQAVKDTPSRGVTHWLDTSSADGTVLDLFDFDFAANPRLRLEVYDQDQDDATPFDNKSYGYWRRGVGQAVGHLNANGRGPVVVACNGLFFNFDTYNARGTASHVSPVVLNGRVLYTHGDNYRWTFGVKSDSQGRPTFKAVHLPDEATLTREFDWAAGGAQRLLTDGQPSPLPRLSQGEKSTFEQMKTSRVSLGWSRDSRHLYLLFVKEPDAEGVSMAAWDHGVPLGGGWSLPDEQRFWQALGAWGAVNSDAGDVAQLAYRLTNGRYELSPAKWIFTGGRRDYGPEFNHAPQGGSLMYWVVREAAQP